MLHLYVIYDKYSLFKWLYLSTDDMSIYDGYEGIVCFSPAYLSFCKSI